MCGGQGTLLDHGTTERGSGAKPAGRGLGVALPENTTADPAKVRSTEQDQPEDVDPKGSYSNTKLQVRQLESLLRKLPSLSGPPAVRPARPHAKTARRLPLDEVQQLITAYQAGVTVHTLGQRFKINRTTVSQILHRHNIPMRRWGLTYAQANEAVQLYAAGWSLARIGIKFDTTANTVRTRLLERGVRMRDAQGRER